MKYGIIVFKNTENIGDDIQSYAASKMVPKVDYYVEREYIDTFVPNEKEYVKVLMNGWFMHYKHNFIPSPYIDPLFISTHFSSYKTYGLENEYIKLSKSYLKKYSPIGCRDTHTKRLLDEYQIDNYISGCITLTLEKFKVNKPDEEYICCVDVSDKVEKFVKANTNINVVRKSHKLDSKVNGKLSYQDRFKNVEKLLKLYQNAKLVITSRLHCALPCIALGTPVILIKDNESIYYKDRIESFLEYVNYFSETDFLKEDFNNILKVRNKNMYLGSKKIILDKIKEDINVKHNNDDLPELDLFKNIYVSRKEKIDRLLDIMLKNQIKIYNENIELKCGVKYWKLQYENSIKDRNKELQSTIAYKDLQIKQTKEYWEKQFDDALKSKDFAVKQNDDYWRNEFNNLLEKYNELLESSKN